MQPFYILQRPVSLNLKPIHRERLSPGTREVLWKWVTLTNRHNGKTFCSRHLPMMSMLESARVMYVTAAGSAGLSIQCHSGHLLRFSISIFSLSLPLPLSLSLSPSPSLSLSPSLSPSLSLSLSLSLFLSLSFSLAPSPPLFIYLFIISLPIYLSIDLYIYLSIYLFIYLSS